MMAQRESHLLATPGNREIQIVVDSSEPDDITASIRGETYSFPSSFPLLLDLVNPGQRVLDLGAHIGTFSLFAATFGYQVVAVEASERNANLLKESVDKNKLENVKIINQAISDRSEVIEFIQAGPYGLVANPSTKNPTNSIAAITVDELLRSVGWDNVAFVKMDIEGSEVKAVLGMKQLLSRQDAPAVLFESNGHTLRLFGSTPNHLIALFEQFGHKCYLVEPGQLIPVRSNQLQPECTVDYLAVKHLLRHLEHWRIQKPMSYREMKAKILAACAYDNEHTRAYTGRALSKADPLLLSDPQVQDAIKALKTDTRVTVQESVRWWREARPSLFRNERLIRLAYAIKNFRP